MKNKENHQRRFGIIAMSKDFITLDQFAEAIEIQAKEDLERSDHRLVGEILVDLGFMNISQVNEVLEELIETVCMFECPKCGIMIYKCPNCGAELR